MDIDLPFSKRLARENSWSIEFALRVIEEYKKFAYLACISEIAVTPSDEVDQAWHLHLIYTQKYWWHFCKQALERELHHNPTKGGTRELEKFEDWYARTKTLYNQEFDTKPPRDIWPSSNERFSRPPHMKRVDTSANFVIRKPSFLCSYARSLVLPLLALLTFSTSAAFGVEVISNARRSNQGIVFIILYAMLTVFVLFLLLIFFIPADDIRALGKGKMTVLGVVVVG